MKNNLKHLLRYFLLFLIAFPLTSCGDDDDTNDEIQTIPRENLFAGTTTTFPVEDPSSVYESSKSTYMVTLNDNGTAVVSINNADFLQGMPELGVMNFRGIKYSIDNSDKESPVITLSCTELTPEIGERPFPAFPITELTATMHPGKKITLSFVCTYRTTPYKVSFTGVPAH